MPTRLQWMIKRKRQVETRRWRLGCVDKGEDLDENDSGVEDVSDTDSDAEECQIESLIKKYL